MHFKLILPQENDTSSCLRDVLCLPATGHLFLKQICREEGVKFTRPMLLTPQGWFHSPDKAPADIQTFDHGGLSCGILNGARTEGLLISNARTMCVYNPQKLNMLFDPSAYDVTAVTISPELAAPNDLIRQTPQNHVVGFRRILEDIVEPAALLETDFPDFLYVSPVVLARLGRNDTIPLECEKLSRYLAEKGACLHLFRVGGQICHLDTAQGILHLLRQIPSHELQQVSASARVPASARLIGSVRLGDNVCIGENAVLVGPVILCDGVQVGPGAVVQNAVLAPNLTVSPDSCLRNAVWLSGSTGQQPAALSVISASENSLSHAAHRDWPLFSYPRLGKRIFDVIFSLMILLLISPLFPVVALMLKLTSSGPVFYRARRQGRHGREFDCLKFRSMMVQADSLQERLRAVNQVDGPQFKIENDPRITGVGKFLRDTCIDELPQFINVLFGQMSVVGPRPSPESENESCPAWRDARLSVRPGITGLWQVCRTRQAAMDFQEWIYYDTQYVRNLSFRQDLTICLKTASKLINTFLDQFG